MLFLRLSKIFRPSSMPSTMLEKSSLRRIMSADSLATSEPVIPIAMPMSAFLMAGESLTPSPVTATICPCSWLPFTMISFWAGVVLANTISFLVSHVFSFLPFSDSGSPSSSYMASVSILPVMTTASAFLNASYQSVIQSSSMTSSTVLPLIILT